MEMERESSGILGDLRGRAAPLAPVESMLAVNAVTLSAGAAPRATLRAFYERVLGMTLLQEQGQEPDADHVTFCYQQRQVTLDRKKTLAGKVAFQVKGLGEALMRLRDNNMSFEMSHTDDGLTRMAILRDPVGNWVLLVETRPL